jgi:hypothetical protein
MTVAVNAKEANRKREKLCCCRPCCKENAVLLEAWNMAGLLHKLDI